MPSTTLQSRINAFESLASPPSSSATKGPPPMIDLVEALPEAAGPRSPPLVVSTASPAKKTSLIDLRDWVVENGPSPPKYNGLDNNKPKSPPLINLESPERKTAPPLPPRTANGSSGSHPQAADSLRVEHTYPPNANGSRHTHASSISSLHSVSLSSDTDSNAPEPPPIDRQYTAASNGSEGSLDESYENVSTTSFGSPISSPLISREWPKRTASIPPKLPQRPSNSSNSSLPKALSPPLQSPPILSRPSSVNSYGNGPPSRSSPATFTTPTITTTQKPVRRPAPPPPPSRSSVSDRSSIQSTSTLSRKTSSSSFRTTTSVSTKASVSSSSSRPTPVPPAVRKRFEGVFNSNVVQKRKAEIARRKNPRLLAPPPTLPTGNGKQARHAVGWRGLSIDLTTTSPDDNRSSTIEDDDWTDGEDESTIRSSERLDGYIVRHIWSRSRLDKRKLAEIWTECDPLSKGSLDCDAFVKGMWRIDEELRRAQLRPFSNHTSRNREGSISRNAPMIPIKTKPAKVILR